MAKRAEPILEHIMKKVDPMEAVVMVLGATAASNGIVPPFTQLLATFTGLTKTSEDWSGIPQGDWIKGGNIDWFTIIFGEHPPGWAQGMAPQTPTDIEPMPADERELARKRMALGCSGAIEALIMYNLVKNPEIMKSLIALPGQVLQGVGEIVPG